MPELTKILFLDQSGNLGGAELSLLDIAQHYQSDCLVGLFMDGPFQTLLRQHHIPVQQLIDRPIPISKTSGFWKSASAIRQLLPLIHRVAKLSQNYGVIYANTQKAFVIGAIAGKISRRPVIYHLRDILSADHFSKTNRQIAITFANTCAAQVIANSQATQQAFIQSGGIAELVEVVYNGFDPQKYHTTPQQQNELRQTLGWDDRFIIGHFSRLSPWKGQHILLEALAQCPESVCALLVGDALFGETDYIKELHAQVKRLGLQQRVKFLGFRQDVPLLMATCDLITHTSTAPEPFGRVIIEAMLCKTPVIAAAAGGAVELIQPNITGWLTPEGDVEALAHQIIHCYQQPAQRVTVVKQAYNHASQQFSLDRLCQSIDSIITRNAR